MVLNLFVEPDFRSSIWGAQYLKAIKDEASLKHYTVNLIKGESLHDVNWEQIYKDTPKRRLLIYIGTSAEAVGSLNGFFTKHHIHPIFINYYSSDSFTELYENYSNIITDYSASLRCILRHLFSLGRTNVALYGINPSSATDEKKKLKFEDYIRTAALVNSNHGVYRNTTCLDACYESFRKDIKKYDAVICSNDIAAMSLLENLKRDGISVPDDLFMVSFGNTKLTKVSYPSVTTSSANMAEFGKQAVRLYSFLSKRDADISITVKVPSTLCVRESTSTAKVRQNAAGDPFYGEAKEHIASPTPSVHAEIGEMPYYYNEKFFSDPKVNVLLRTENLLSSLVNTDAEILDGLMNAEPVSQMADRLYTSQQAIAYRIKRMCRIAEVKGVNELLNFLSAYYKNGESRLKYIFNG